jgi:apolipoprotein N-acyltransferase
VAKKDAERKAEKRSTKDRTSRKAFLLCCASGLLGALAFPQAFPWNDGQLLFSSGWLEPLAFVCLLPALWTARNRTVRGAFFSGFWAGCVFFAGVFWWVNIAMVTFGGMPNIASIPALALLVAWCAFHWGLAFALVRFLERAHGLPMGATLAPVWMAAELMRNYFCSGFPWGNLGYSQMRNLYFSQLGSLMGVYGVALAVALVNGALFEAYRARRGERPVPKLLVSTAALALLLGHGYGFLRARKWEDMSRSADTLSVAVIQGNIDQKIKNSQASHAAMVLSSYNPPTLAADAVGVDLILWPEGAYPVSLPMEAQALYPRTLSKPQYRARLLIGVDLYNPAQFGQMQNAAFLVSPDLRVEGRYAKYHLVPFGEYVLWDLDKLLPIDNLVPGTFVPGTSLEPFSVPTADGRATVKVGVEICFDAIFPEISRTYVNKGAQLLVNLTNDAWYGFSSAPHQFLRMVAMRAVETGRPIARAANTGISAFIDPLGRVHDATSLGLVKSDDRRVSASLRVAPEWRMRSLPILTERTVYSIIGDAVAYAAALFCVGGFVWGVARERRMRQLGKPIGDSAGGNSTHGRGRGREDPRPSRAPRGATGASLTSNGKNRESRS